MDAIRLQQLYRAIRNLEISITEKRQYLARKRSGQFVSRLLDKRKPKVARIVEKLAAAVEHRSLREMQNLPWNSSGDTAPPTNATHRFTGSIHMPIEAPSNSPIVSRTHSEFVFLCEQFVFRPSTVDRDDSHERCDDGAAVTTVNFKSYTQTDPDQERRLFDFLIRKLKPKPAYESKSTC